MLSFAFFGFIFFFFGCEMKEKGVGVKWGGVSYPIWLRGMPPKFAAMAQS